MMKKDQGSIGHFLPMVVTAVFFCCLIMVCIFFSEAMLRINQIDLAARRYLLKMETKGYLDEAMERALSEELAALGVGNLDFSGSTRADAGYGREICLILKGEVRLWRVEVSGFTQFIFSRFTVPLSIRKISVAKH